MSIKLHTDLSIGNCLLFGNETVFVSGIFKSHFRCENINGIDTGTSLQSNYLPIPITEECLKKLGFRLIKENEGFGTGTWSNGYLSLFFYKGHVDIRGCNPKFVHELQNLYRAIERKELEWNPPA